MPTMALRAVGALLQLRERITVHSRAPRLDPSIEGPWGGQLGAKKKNHVFLITSEHDFFIFSGRAVRTSYPAGRYCYYSSIGLEVIIYSHHPQKNSTFLPTRVREMS